MSADPDVTLERALAYQHKYPDDIPYRFMDDWDVELDDARLLFADVKRFLWANYKSGWELLFIGPLSILDEMYHFFILSTQEYTAYCNTVYGRYIHHIPITKSRRDKDREEFARDPVEGKRKLLAERDHQRRHIAALLGVEVLARWYVEYPVKFGDEFYRTRRKPNGPGSAPDAELLEMAQRLRA